MTVDTNFNLKTYCSTFSEVILNGSLETYFGNKKEKEAGARRENLEEENNKEIFSKYQNKIFFKAVKF